MFFRKLCNSINARICPFLLSKSVRMHMKTLSQTACSVLGSLEDGRISARFLRFAYFSTCN